MAGTRAGGLAAAERNKELYGDDFYSRLGKKGGLAQTENTRLKGYGTHRDLAREHGKLNGSKNKKPKETQ